MKVLACGSRGYPDDDVYTWWDEIFSDLAPVEVLVHGDCRGPDQVSGAWFDEKVPAAEVIAMPADWNRHGRAAGFIRNEQMLDQQKPDLVVAFWDGQSRGTAHTIAEAAKRGIPVRVLPPR